MPKIEVRTEHQLSADDATERLRLFGEQLKKKHGNEVTILKEDWNDHTLDFSLGAKGLKIDGRLVVTDRQAMVSCNLPFRLKDILVGLMLLVLAQTDVIL